RERSKQHAVQRAENRGIGAYTEAQAQYCECGEAGRSGDLTNGVAEIVNEIVGPGERPHVARSLLGLLDTVQGEACPALGLRATDAAALAGANLHFKMERQLIVQIGVCA